MKTDFVRISAAFCLLIIKVKNTALGTGTEIKYRWKFLHINDSMAHPSSAVHNRTMLYKIIYCPDDGRLHKLKS
jgi:hypothetical protein